MSSNTSRAPYLSVVIAISQFCPFVWALKAQYFELTLRLLMSYMYGAPSKARNANVVYKWTYVWQR